jgi:restriction system protein
MPFPKQSDVEIPLLEVLRESGGSAEPKDIYPKLAERFPDLTPEEQEQRLESSPSTRKWWNLVQWVRQHLVQAGEIDGGGVRVDGVNNPILVLHRELECHRNAVCVM